MTKLLVAAALLVPSLAHAEYLAPTSNEVRAQVAPKRTAKSDRAPARVTLRTAAAEAPATTRGLEIDDVLAKVNGVYMAGMQRCYRKSVAVDPFMASKVDLAFKVNAEGQVVSSMQGAGMERCLSTLMAHWRFGVALDDTGTPTEASFKISLVLR
jgi:hypothetical protein